MLEIYGDDRPRSIFHGSWSRIICPIHFPNNSCMAYFVQHNVSNYLYAFCVVFSIWEFIVGMSLTDPPACQAWSLVPRPLLISGSLKLLFLMTEYMGFCKRNDLIRILNYIFWILFHVFSIVQEVEALLLQKFCLSSEESSLCLTWTCINLLIFACLLSFPNCLFISNEPRLENGDREPMVGLGAIRVLVVAPV